MLISCLRGLQLCLHIVESKMSVQVSEAEEQEQLQVDSIKEQEGFLTQAKRAAALARWRRLQASLLIMSTGVRCKLAIVLTNLNTERHALCRPVNGVGSVPSILPSGIQCISAQIDTKASGVHLALSVSKLA